MTSPITISERQVQNFLERADNPHLVARGRRVRVVGERYYRMYGQGLGRLIMTRADLNEIDPDAAGYEPGLLAELLADYAAAAF